MSDVKLMPYPFCGEQPMIEDLREGEPDIEITCTNKKCPAIISIYEATEDKTIAAWNTRAESPVEKAAGEMREALRECPTDLGMISGIDDFAYRLQKWSEKAQSALAEFDKAKEAPRG